MMEELNSETMILLLSVLISKIVTFVIVRSVKIVLLIFIIVQVYMSYLFGVNDVIIDCEISNSDVCVKYFVLYDFVFVVCLALSVKIVLGFLVCILLILNILLKWIILMLLFLMVY
jgi:hypothetical protein